jgi:hypothetical protein
MAPKFENFQPSRTIVRIDSVDGTGIDIGTMEYAVSFGGAKDDAGAVRRQHLWESARAWATDS